MQEEWDSVYRVTPIESIPWDEGGPNKELVRLIKSGKIEKGDVLDICSGTGSNAIYLAKNGYRCHGVDISSAAKNLAGRKLENEGVTCELSVGDASQLPYPDNFFSLVFDRGCFQVMPAEDREAFINGLFRVIKPRGKYMLLCFSVNDHPDTGIPHSFSPDDLRRYFSLLFKISYIRQIVSGDQNRKAILFSSLMEKRILV
jgi:ubiquinone/menaquinone biosynthesis C-methylase UbiE